MLSTTVLRKEGEVWTSHMENGGCVAFRQGGEMQFFLVGRREGQNSLATCRALGRYTNRCDAETDSSLATIVMDS